MSTLRFSKRIFSVTLLLLPRWFREEYAEDMMRNYVERSVMIGRRSGWAARVAFQTWSVMEVPAQALRVRWNRPISGQPVLSVSAGCARLGTILSESVRSLGGVRYTLRSLKSTWLLCSIAVLTIAMAVGLTTTTFSIVYGVLLRPLPFPGADRLMAMELTARNGGIGTPQFEALDLRDFRLRQTSFEGLDGYFRRRVSVTDADGYAQSMAAGFVTASALERLEVRPYLGRTFLPGEDFTADIRTVVLGHQVWRERYGGRDVVGTTIRVDGRSLEVVGVMPAGFEFPVAEQIWLPMDFDLPTEDRGSGRSFAVFGRLKEGIDIRTAAAEAEAIAGQLSAENPRLFSALGANVYPFAERHLPRGIAALLQVMLAAVFGVLLIACANVANLLLARSLAKAYEVSIRRALGASRPRIAGQFLLESMLLSATGCTLGLGLTAISLDVVIRSLPNLSLPYWVDISLATPALVFTAGLILLVTLVAGALPALRASKSDPHYSDRRLARLNHNSRGSSGRPLSRTGGRLVTAQIALSCALLIGAGLLVKSLIHLRSLDMGYDPERVIAADIWLPDHEYPEPEVRSGLFAEVLERASSLPGVRGVSLARSAPGTGPTFAWKFKVQGEGYLISIT